MSETLKPIQWWQIWSNPIFRRYLRSRLRPAPLITWIIIVLTFTATLFFLFFYGSEFRLKGSPEAAAQDACIPVLFIQMLILLFMGTGSVAGGISREAADGMVDYQRLTPMTPLSKIVGYLFGLPVREYVLFATTVPFTVFCIFVGNIPLGVVAEVYGMLFTSAILYHLTGCVAGTVVKRRHFAGRVAQIMVIFLYFVLPGLLGPLGFVLFEYLTMRPILTEQFESIRGPAFSNLPSPEKIGGVPLFDWKLDTLSFSLLIQCSLIVIFMVILYRKWRQPTNHLLGKNFAFIVQLWILTLITGNALPIIKNENQLSGGRSERVAAMLVEQRMAEKDLKEIEDFNPREATNVIAQSSILASLGLGFLALTFGMITIITPDSDKFTRALRKAQKLKGNKNTEKNLSTIEVNAPHNADGATSLWHTIALAVLAFGAWSILIQNTQNLIKESHSTIYNPLVLSLIPLGLVPYALCYHAFLERFGRRATLLFVIFAWLVPLLTSAVLGVRGIETIPTLLFGLSALASPVFLLLFPLTEASDNERLLQISGYFSLFAHMVLLIFLWWTLNRHKNRIRTQVSKQAFNS
ncbi:MAG: hypothetical protein CMP45_06120 [Rickettsiales bacterium]|nr:hypothetical protein [Verrucomicrobiaceae bacterium]MBV64069.1 hypothetical protein [Rickettsiales bacterium]